MKTKIILLFALLALSVSAFSSTRLEYSTYSHTQYGTTTRNFQRGWFSFEDDRIIHFDGRTTLTYMLNVNWVDTQNKDGLITTVTGPRGNTMVVLISHANGWMQLFWNFFDDRGNLIPAKTLSLCYDLNID